MMKGTQRGRLLAKVDMVDELKSQLKSMAEREAALIAQFEQTSSLQRMQLEQGAKREAKAAARIEKLEAKVEKLEAKLGF